MRSINVYWGLGKTDRRQEPVRPLRRKPVKNRFTAVECITATAAVSMATGVAGGAYRMDPWMIGRRACGELKPKMYSNDLVFENGGGSDA
jgi:hypothetical protein